MQNGHNMKFQPNKVSYLESFEIMFPKELSSSFKAEGEFLKRAAVELFMNGHIYDWTIHDAIREELKRRQINASVV